MRKPLASPARRRSRDMVGLDIAWRATTARCRCADTSVLALTLSLFTAPSCVTWLSLNLKVLRKRFLESLLTGRRREAPSLHVALLWAWGFLASLQDSTAVLCDVDCGMLGTLVLGVFNWARIGVTLDDPTK